MRDVSTRVEASAHFRRYHAGMLEIEETSLARAA
jgi:hypothetical protein